MSEKTMIKAFNDGYLLQQHKPELANALEQGFKDQNNAYAKGFSAGAKEYQKSQTKEKSQTSSYQTYLKSKGLGQKQSQSKEQSKGKDQDLSL